MSKILLIAWGYFIEFFLVLSVLLLINIVNVFNVVINIVALNADSLIIINGIIITIGLALWGFYISSILKSKFGELLIERKASTTYHYSYAYLLLVLIASIILLVIRKNYSAILFDNLLLLVIFLAIVNFITSLKNTCYLFKVKEEIDNLQHIKKNDLP